jgi:hypothetical protein
LAHWQGEHHVQRHHLQSAIAIVVLTVFFGACSDESTTTAPPVTDSATVLVGNDSGAGAGDAVIRQAPDGGVISATETDATGRAALELTAGDMITVANSWQEGSLRLQTVVGVKPGDDLQFFWTENEPSEHTETVVTAGEFPDPVNKVAFGNGCWSGRGLFTLPYTSTVNDNCGADTGLLNMCWQTEYEDVKQAFAFVTDMPFDPSGTTTVDLTERWRTDWQRVNLALPMVPDGLHAVSLTSWPERDGTSFNILETLNTAMGGPVPTVHLLLVPRGFPETVRVELSISGESETTHLGERFALDEQTDTLGFSVVPVSVTTDAIEFAEAGRPAFSWAAGGANIDVDYILVELAWVTDSVQVSWTFYLPPDRTSFQVPELPNALAAYRPPVASVANEMSASLVHGGDTYVDGYDHFRDTIYRAWPFDEREGGLAGRNFETHVSFVTPGGNDDKGLPGFRTFASH